MKRIALNAVLIACLVGCGQSPTLPVPKTDGRTKSSGRTTMQQFTIGSTDFGIDATASSFTVDNTTPNRPTITIELSGNQSVFDALTADDDSEWSWAVYPPGFYLRSFPCQVDPSRGIATARLTLDDIDDYDFAIYMMEHNNIDDVTVKLIPDKSLQISGRVDLFGEDHDFAINWLR
ncbi:MAG: hypothetical protein U1E05_07575 [Patescibacteria group bacterium]|nr:hypothetical protein [Patescibacteria group bacterium]